MRRASLACLGVALLSCADQGPSSASSIQLTAAQAATIMGRVALAVQGDADLGWLADSISLVINAGATADSVAIDSDLGPAFLYAVGLQRRIIVANAFSTFNFIGFNDPSSPAHFVIVSGYATGGSTPPASASGPIPSSSANAHFFEISGGGVRRWRGASGSASFSSGAEGGECGGFVPSQGVTCTRAELQVGFSVPLANEETLGGGSSTRLASIASVSVPGALITITPGQ